MMPEPGLTKEAQMSMISLVIATPDRTLRRRLATEFRTSSEIAVVAETDDLMTTYTEVEEREPLAVVIAGRLARLPEYSQV